MVKNIGSKKPQINSQCYIAENATVVGDVKIGKDSSVWFGAVLRGDMAQIEIGEKSNIQDNAVIHVGLKKDVKIGNCVTVGHSAIIHGAEIGDNTLIGMGAIIMDGAKIGKNVIIGAGALVSENTVIPDGKIAYGSPAKIIKDAGITQITMNKMNAISYIQEAKKTLVDKTK